MKKIILFLLLIPSISFAAAPTRTYNYTSGTTIRSSEVTANEDSIFNYLQGGVDVIKDGSVVNADINSSAAIANSKLNLTTVTQDITHSGTLVQSGTLTSSGTATFVSADINGGAMDNVAIGATVPTTGTFTTITTSNALGLLYGGTGSKLIAPSTSSLMFVAAGGTVDFATVGSGLSFSSKTLSVPVGITASADTETGGVTCDAGEDTVLSVTKTITAGKTVFLSASGYSSAGSGGCILTIYLKHGSTVAHTVVGPNGTVDQWAVNAVVTGLSGSTVFSVTGKTDAANRIVFGNLSVIEF
jgi:hypothetical protein